MSLGAPPGVGRKIALAVSEACSNAVVHAYRDRPTGSVAVRVRRHDETLRVEVSDEGSGMRPRTDSPGVGLGTPMMAILSDHLEIGAGPDGVGTVVRLDFAL
jgi:serine/threonine-protein kinase RsbW